MSFNAMTAGGGSGGFLMPTRRTRSGPVARERGRPGRSRSKATEKTYPALAFVFPYHEMLILNLLGVGEFQVKTRNSNWNYRGPVLLYTSHGRYHRVPAGAYGLDSNKFPRGVIVGVATIVNSRPLTWEEKVKVTANFNCVTLSEAEEMLMGCDGDHVVPCPIGVFLKDVKRFKKPVPFKPRPGAIGIMRVPVAKVAKALKKVGINPKSL